MPANLLSAQCGKIPFFMTDAITKAAQGIGQSNRHWIAYSLGSMHGACHVYNGMADWCRQLKRVSFSAKRWRSSVFMMAFTLMHGASMP